MKQYFPIALYMLAASMIIPGTVLAGECEIIRSNAFLRQAYCPAGLDATKAESYGKSVCGSDTSCNVWIWTNKKQVPAAMMMTDAEVNNASYVWISATSTLNGCKKNGC